jgi:hypothetical protein
MYYLCNTILFLSFLFGFKTNIWLNEKLKKIYLQKWSINLQSWKKFAFQRSNNADTDGGFCKAHSTTLKNPPHPKFKLSRLFK